MREVTVNKDNLRAIVATNRTVHEATYRTAAEAYLQAAEAKLARLMDEVADADPDGDLPKLYVQLPVPERHLAEYDRALGMLDLHTEDEVTLDSATYRNLVDDEWDWTRQWDASTAAYLEAG